MTTANIFVVEDESIVAKDIQNSLRNLGYGVIGTAASGEEALAQLAQVRPDLVLMDVMLKGALDGIETAEQIQAHYSIPVVYLTAFTDDDTLKRAKTSQAFGYLLKPFEDRELRTTIEIALYKHNLERQLRESREWLRTTLRCISEAVIATNAAGAVQFINPVAANLTGWNRAEALGRKLSDVFCLTRPDGPLQIDTCLEKVLTTKTTVGLGIGIQLVARDGKQYPVDAGMAPIADEGNASMGVVIIFRDITERQRTEHRERELYEKLSRARRMESLGILAGGVANDLNNILGPMVNYPDTILKKLPPDHAAQADLDMVKNSARKAIDVVRDLMTLGRIGRLPLKPVSLNNVINAYLQSPAFQALQHSAPLVTLEVNLGQDLRPVSGSESHLQELVANLISYTFDALANEGKIGIQTVPQILTKPQEGYELIEPGEYVVLHIRRDGPGIPEEDLNRLFEPFYMKRKMRVSRGSGLGLAVVYGVLKDHKGFIDVQAPAGRGLGLRVYLPVTGAAAAPVSPSVKTPYQGSETILVVDDDEEQRKATVSWLRHIGYQVLSAPHGRAAVETIRTRDQSGGDPVAVVLLDMVMGDDWDGLKTYQHILEINPRQKAIMVSGFAVIGRIKEALRLGAGQYLQKPYTAEELGRAVRQELDKPAPSPAV